MEAMTKRWRYGFAGGPFRSRSPSNRLLVGNKGEGAGGRVEDAGPEPVLGWSFEVFRGHGVVGVYKLSAFVFAVRMAGGRLGYVAGDGAHESFSRCRCHPGPHGTSKPRAVVKCFLVAQS